MGPLGPRAVISHTYLPKWAALSNTKQTRLASEEWKPMSDNSVSREHLMRSFWGTL